MVTIRLFFTLVALYSSTYAMNAGFGGGGVVNQGISLGGPTQTTTTTNFQTTNTGFGQNNMNNMNQGFANNMNQGFANNMNQGFANNMNQGFANNMNGQVLGGPGMYVDVVTGRVGYVQNLGNNGQFGHGSAHAGQVMNPMARGAINPSMYPHTPGIMHPAMHPMHQLMQRRMMVHPALIFQQQVMAARMMAARMAQQAFQNQAAGFQNQNTGFQGNNVGAFPSSGGNNVLEQQLQNLVTQG